MRNLANFWQPTHTQELDICKKSRFIVKGSMAQCCSMHLDLETLYFCSSDWYVFLFLSQLADLWYAFLNRKVKGQFHLRVYPPSPTLVSSALSVPAMINVELLEVLATFLAEDWTARSWLTAPQVGWYGKLFTGITNSIVQAPCPWLCSYPTKKEAICFSVGFLYFSLPCWIFATSLSRSLREPLCIFIFSSVSLWLSQEQARLANQRKRHMEQPPEPL